MEACESYTQMHLKNVQPIRNKRACYFPTPLNKFTFITCCGYQHNGAQMCESPDDGSWFYESLSLSMKWIMMQELTYHVTDAEAEEISYSVQKNNWWYKISQCKTDKTKWPENLKRLLCQSRDQPSYSKWNICDNCVHCSY